jgi:myosin-18
MPPHIFASAQIAYREMLNTRQDQSIVFMGRSGSGKTYNVHHVLQYLTLSAGTVNNVLTGEYTNSPMLKIYCFQNVL